MLGLDVRKSISSPISEKPYSVKCHLNNFNEYIIERADISTNNLCIVDNFKLTLDKNSYVSSPLTLYDTGCSVLSGLILSSIFARKSRFSIHEKPLGKILYNVRAADKSVMLGMFSSSPISEIG